MDKYVIQLGLFEGEGDWMTYFGYIGDRYSELIQKLRIVKRIDCLRIQTDVIIQVNFIKIYGYELGMKHFLDSVGNSIYNPRNRLQQTQDDLDCYPQEIAIEFSKHYKTISRLGITIPIPNLIRYTDESVVFSDISDFHTLLNGESDNLKKYFGPGLCIPMFYKISSGLEEEGCHPHAFIMYINGMNKVYIFDPHFNLSLIELHVYNPLQDLINDQPTNQSPPSDDFPHLPHAPTIKRYVKFFYYLLAEREQGPVARDLSPTRLRPPPARSGVRDRVRDRDRVGGSAATRPISEVKRGREGASEGGMKIGRSYKSKRRRKKRNSKIKRKTRKRRLKRKSKKKSK